MIYWKCKRHKESGLDLLNLDEFKSFKDYLQKQTTGKKHQKGKYGYRPVADRNKFLINQRAPRWHSGVNENLVQKRFGFVINEGPVVPVKSVWPN